MVKKCAFFTFCCLLFMAASSTLTSAQTNAENSDPSAAKVKAKVTERAKAEDTFIKLKMRDGRKLSGNASQAGDDSFTLTDPKTKQSTTIAYTDVAQVRRKGFSATSIIAIGAVAGAAAIVLAVVLIPICNEGGC